MPPEITTQHLDRHVHPRLRTRVRLYLGISVLIIIFIVYRIATYGGGVLYPLLALAIGIAIGLILSRMFKISWDTEAEKVVSRMDVYGALFLVAYIVVELSGEHLIRAEFSGAEVLTIILSLAGGAVLGRGLGMSRRMFQVLRENIEN